ncbi:MAG: HD-GYP domain-containing protein [Bacillota bacterium]
MRRIHVDKLNNDMVLAKTIYSSDGNILLNAGIKLKEIYINRFRELGITEIYIDDHISHDIVADDVISEETRFEARIAVKHAMDSMKMRNSLNIKQARNVVGKIVDELMNVPDAMVNLQDLKTTDNYTFNHSANVCVLSVITGISMGYDKERLRQLGLGALLHDIGKVKIPQEILNKPASLTPEEFEEIKKHSSYGYEILKRSMDLSTYASYVALTHHERYNGSGYPLGLRGEEIHEFSRIVAVADVYDALTSDRVYKKRSNINDAIEYLIGMGYHQFDYGIVRNFIEHIAIYPSGVCVKLNTGEIAIVVDVNKKYPNRPIVRIFKDRDGNEIKELNEIDLTKYNNILIEDIIEDI